MSKEVHRGVPDTHTRFPHLVSVSHVHGARSNYIRVDARDFSTGTECASSKYIRNHRHRLLLQVVLIRTKLTNDKIVLTHPDDNQHYLLWTD